MCVPNTLRSTVLYFCHDVPASGHMGVEKTLVRVLQRYWWPRVTVDVRKYVLSVSSVNYISTRPVPRSAFFNR